ncbi:universal stress protein [Variovorax sp. J22R133]|uniref:universal stress protein n=1 Tax=Variovorax brevis TaxID=3053503 RepID=UPI002578A606|nr:universal stress protein [Variovorax sp. J22R133]MDM0118133.1 universal stress protein [Variovorax sp. J22R133]
MFKRILVTTEGSPRSETAVNKAIELSLLSGAELRVFTVVPLEPFSLMEGTPVYAQKQQVETYHQALAVAQALLDAAKSAALAKGVRNVEAVVKGSNEIGESIIEFAKSEGCDLIVMASHGRRTVARLLMGSETLHVLTYSHIPVLAYR